MFAKINSLGLMGLNAFSVEVETDISKGQPMFEIIGLPDLVVKESRERIKSAMRSCSIEFPVARVTVNLAPADTKKSGSMHDLAVLVSLIRAMGVIKNNLDDSSFIGEVSLSGAVRSVNGVLPMTILAKENGIKNIYVPADNAYEASVVDGINVYGVNSVEQLLNHFYEHEHIQPQKRYIPPDKRGMNFPDFSDVRGQFNAKYALEIAAAGGHNALLIGSPGCGKSMLAKRVPSILPEMTFEESIQTTNIYSISGMTDKNNPLITVRPFRSPHHTISSAGLAGGGTIPHPGEISLAHNGVLFLDELAEFDRRTLEILRQPVEDRKVTISRASGTFTYPCSIMLIGAMNPCPCGYFGHPKHQCTCSKGAMAKYLAKISGPMLDRFDLHIEVAPVEFDSLSSNIKEESSESIRQRVQKAREIQNERFKGLDISCNAEIPPSKIREFCVMDNQAVETIRKIFDKLGLSVRSYDRILKVARTIADIDGKEVIGKSHIAQASQLRSLDRKYWKND
ncbi:MAG: YifB family Mg chelatase-like AAA ATPase [Oscillospiraceae bacterium]